MIQEDNIRFIKFKNGDNIIAHTKDEYDTHIEIARPIALVFENYGDDDEQQLVKIKEWIPPLIAKFNTVTIDKKEIFFILEVQQDFIDHYLELSELFFNNLPKQDDGRKQAIRDQADKTVVSLEDIWKNIKKH